MHASMADSIVQCINATTYAYCGCVCERKVFNLLPAECEWDKVMPTSFFATANILI
jgi:hypothetical protein